MKLLLTKSICTIVLLLFVETAFCQQQNTDSLWRLTINTKNDSIKYNLIIQIGLHVAYAPLDTNLVWAKKLLDYGEKNNDLPIKLTGNILFSNLYLRLADFVKCQEYTVKAAAIAEAIPNNANYLALVNNFKSFADRDPLKQIAYMRKAVLLSTNDLFKAVLLTNATALFLQNNQLDSALVYAQRANEVFLKTKDSLQNNLPSFFGRIYLQLNQTEIAYGYFKKSILLADKRGNDYFKLVAYGGMAAYFTTIKNDDSALVYMKKPFLFTSQEAYISKVGSSKWLYEYYLKKHQQDSAIKYLLFYAQGNDSLNSSKKIQELQLANIREELRQRDLEKEKAEDSESRNHNIQLAITAIGILSAVILFLLLSRSVLVSHKVVAFLSVLVLLVVFEFINLLIHPWLEKITHHSPILMLLALVAIAALIVPLHHKLEHWTTQKLVEKNKAIRLANAKKTIEELEKPTN